ncbi:hypothetical protein VUR80DRAFT_73 [Thermomyces stellatus]
MAFRSTGVRFISSFQSQGGGAWVALVAYCLVHLCTRAMIRWKRAQTIALDVSPLLAVHDKTRNSVLAHFNRQTGRGSARRTSGGRDLVADYFEARSGLFREIGNTCPEAGPHQ